MITGFRSRPLKRFFYRGDARGLQASHVRKIRRILARLHAATDVRDLDSPGFRLHPLKGDRQGEWAIDVSAAWRITFRFDGQNCYDVHYEDYH